MKVEKGVANKARSVRRRFKLDDGTAIPGVTTVLGVINKPALIKWANNLGLEGIDSSAYVDETAMIGTLAHALIQEYLGGDVCDLSYYSKAQIDAAGNAMRSFYEWEKQSGHVMKTRAVELSLIQPSLMYGGVVDWYGEIDGRMWLVDFKTSSALWPEHFYQVAAYRELLVHNDYKVDGVRVLRVGRTEDEGFEDRVVSAAQLDAAFCVFLNALTLYHAQKTYNGMFVNKRRTSEQ